MLSTFYLKNKWYHLIQRFLLQNHLVRFLTPWLDIELLFINILHLNNYRNNEMRREFWFTCGMVFSLLLVYITASNFNVTICMPLFSNTSFLIPNPKVGYYIFQWTSYHFNYSYHLFVLYYEKPSYCLVSLDGSKLSVEELPTCLHLGLQLY